jgi:ATP-dependent RNA helicase DDX19/DBP5
MHQEGHAVALITGESTIEQRIAVLNRYREGKEKLLITTNLCARGIDVEQVTVVVNYDIPMDVHRQVDFETYLHRIGRTGRFGRSGLAINFVDGRRTMEMVKKIEEHFGRKISKMEIDDPDSIEQAVAS